MGHNHDILVDYAAGKQLAFLKSNTEAGRNFLSDNVKSRRIHKTVMCEPQELLDLIPKIMKAKLVIRWRNK
jgi:hypothetical protein